MGTKLMVVQGVLDSERGVPVGSGGEFCAGGGRCAAAVQGP